MSRTIIKNTAGLLTASAVTGALLLSSPGLAQAANGGTKSDTDRSATDGTGHAKARAHANDNGRLEAFTRARGANAEGGGVPGAPATSTPTNATATAQVNKRVQVADGTYRVVITYKGLQGSTTDRGDDSRANVNRRSSANFVSQTGGDDRQVNRVQAVPNRKQAKKTVLVIKVPNNASGFLRVKALIKATSDADGQGSFAKSTATTSGVSFKVTRI